MLISAEDVARTMVRDFTDLQKAAVEDIIQGLEDDLGAYLKRPLVPEDVVDEVVSYRDGKVRLQKTPVVSVEAFSIGGTPLDATNYTVESWGLSEVYSVFGPSSLLVPAPTLLVSYRAGLPGDDPDSDFGRAVRSKLKVAARRNANQVVLEKASGVKRLQVEGTTLEFQGEGWLEGELASMRRWRRRVVRT